MVPRETSSFCFPSSPGVSLDFVSGPHIKCILSLQSNESSDKSVRKLRHQNLLVNSYSLSIISHWDVCGLTSLNVLRTLSPAPFPIFASSRIRSTMLISTMKPSKMFHRLFRYPRGPDAISFNTISIKKTKVKTCQEENILFIYDSWLCVFQ